MSCGSAGMWNFCSAFMINPNTKFEVYSMVMLLLGIMFDAVLICSFLSPSSLFPLFSFKNSSMFIKHVLGFPFSSLLGGRCNDVVWWYLSPSTRNPNILVQVHSKQYTFLNHSVIVILQKDEDHEKPLINCDVGHSEHSTRFPTLTILHFSWT